MTRRNYRNRDRKNMAAYRPELAQTRIFDNRSEEKTLFDICRQYGKGEMVGDRMLTLVDHPSIGEILAEAYTCISLPTPRKIVQNPAPTKVKVSLLGKAIFIAGAGSFLYSLVLASQILFI